MRAKKRTVVTVVVVVVKIEHLLLYLDLSCFDVVLGDDDDSNDFVILAIVKLTTKPRNYSKM
jgi:hypothetical protein